MNQEYQCWMCEQFDIAEDEPLPPPPETRRRCFLLPCYSLRSAGNRICHERGARLAPARLKKAKPKKPRPNTHIQNGEKDHDLALENLDENLLDCFLRCVLNATAQGLIKIGQAKVTKDELLALKNAGLIEFRTYNCVTRSFVPKIARLKRWLEDGSEDMINRR